MGITNFHTPKNKRHVSEEVFSNKRAKTGSSRPASVGNIKAA